MSDTETPDQGCRNLRWALALLEGLVQGGMRRVVLSPGSRSTPLVLAAQRQPLIELTPILDERSAAFFALGLARASGRAVAVVCTSGSALAHWFPAVIEACESGVPLILLSADRPPERRGWGANQTIDQTHLFGRFIREFHDPGPAEAGLAALKGMRALGLRAARVSQGRRSGPVHINLPFREPLVPGPLCEGAPGAEPDRARDADAEPLTALFAESAQLEPAWRRGREWPDLATRLTGRGIICCGPMIRSDASAAAIWRCASMLGAPVLADPLCGLRFGPASGCRITRYDSLLRNAAAARDLRPDWVLRFGAMPVSKTLQVWLDGVPAVLVDPAERWSDPSHDVCAQIAAEPTTLSDWLQGLSGAGIAMGCRDSAWTERWTAAEQQVDRLAAAFLAQAPWSEGRLIGQLLDRLTAHEGLFCANSLPIRQLDTWSGQGERPLRFFGHRGASGIDGQTSTLAGLNAGRTGVARGVTGLLGDLSFIHDLSGLLLMDRLDRPCIVLNNGGGRIFDYLPQSGLDEFERLWRTPPRVAPDALAQAFGLRHRAVADEAGFAQALDEAIAAGDRAEPAGLIEVKLDAQLSLRAHQTFWSEVRAYSIIESE